MRKNPLSNMSAHGGIITSEFLENFRNENVQNPRVLPASFAVFGGACPSNKRELDLQVSESWDELLERWDSISSRYLKMDVSEARSKWILPLLRGLGFDPVYNKQDIVLEESGDLKFRLSHRGWVDSRAPMIHTVAPSQDLEEKPLEETESSRRERRRSPHDELQAYLNLNKFCKWGIVSNGVLLRVLREFYHTTTKGYIEFDIENIFRERSFTDFRVLYRLAHASRFLQDKDGMCHLEQFYKESVAAGVAVGENLRKNVKRAIEALGNGFLTPELAEKMVEDEELCKNYYAELLRVVYRMLFLLFAEQRAMLPTRDSLYADEYSLNRLREFSETRRGKDEHCDLWDGLKVTFRMLKNGCSELKVFGYNGSLFDDEEIPILSGLSCKNSDILMAVRHLTVIEEERVLKRINYLDLGVEEIGSIYESLLDFTPKVSANEEEIDGEKVPAKTFFLDPRGAARKTTGSYYTHPRLIDELVKSALKPVVEERLAKSTDKEKALLSVKICDPACGSGAFLIAASNYMARELAKLRTGQAEPSDREVRKARRDVLQHCVYGVDLNPMAVELAKVSLWINSCVEDMPLNFLDHHIKCGNSLVGASPQLLKKGILDVAFAPIEGDDKDFAKMVKKQNSFERKQKLIEEFEIVQEKNWTLEYLSLSDITEITPSHVEEKKRKYASLIRSPEWSSQKELADAWTASFFWTLTKDSPKPPTQAIFRIIHNNRAKEISDQTFQLIRELAQQNHFFHWYLEFPDIFGGEAGGFDCILGNPPWEKMKLHEREFFSAYDPDIANASTAAIRKKKIERLKETRRTLFKRYKNSLRFDEATNKFARQSGRFPLTARGDVNTYKLFTELASSIISVQGRVGLVVKTGIITDDTTKEFFGHLVSSRQIVSLFDFSNKKGIFQDVIPNERFCLLTLSSLTKGPEKFNISLLNEDLDDLSKMERRYLMSAEDIALMNPNTHTCPMPQTPLDVEMCRRIYSRNPILIREKGSGEINPWGIEYFRMFDMTNDSSLFRDKEWLEEHGYTREKNFFMAGKDVFLPLYEAKLVDLFDHRHGTFEGVPREHRFGIKAEPNDPALEQKADIDYEVEPRYWVNSKEVWKRYEEKHITQDVVFAFRHTCRAYTDSRTARGSLIPAYAACNICPLLVFRDEDNVKRVTRMIEFACIFSSITFDYLVRQKMSSGGLNRFIVIQIPVPTPESFLKRFEFAGQTKTASEWILERAPTLFFTTRSFEKFFSYIGVSKPVVWNQIERFESQCFCDALIAQLYGLTKEDYGYILTRFPILSAQETKRFGEYRTQKLCLSYFDQIREVLL